MQSIRYLCSLGIMPIQNIYLGEDHKGAEFTNSKQTYSDTDTVLCSTDI